MLRTSIVVMNGAVISGSMWLFIFIEKCHMYILHEVAVNKIQALGESFASFSHICSISG